MRCPWLLVLVHVIGERGKHLHLKLLYEDGSRLYHSGSGYLAVSGKYLKLISCDSSIFRLLVWLLLKLSSLYYLDLLLEDLSQQYASLLSEQMLVRVAGTAL